MIKFQKKLTTPSLPATIGLMQKTNLPIPQDVPASRASFVWDSKF